MNGLVTDQRNCGGQLTGFWAPSGNTGNFRKFRRRTGKWPRRSAVESTWGRTKPEWGWCDGCTAARCGPSPTALGS